MGGVDVYLRGQEIHNPAQAGPLVPEVMDDMWVGLDVYLRGQEIHRPAVAGGPLVPQVMDDMWVG